jgi:hypothetical protein
MRGRVKVALSPVPHPDPDVLSSTADEAASANRLVACPLGKTQRTVQGPADSGFEDEFGQGAVSDYVGEDSTISDSVAMLCPGGTSYLAGRRLDEARAADPARDRTRQHPGQDARARTRRRPRK